MKVTKRISKLNEQLAGRMAAKTRKGLVVKLARLEAMRRAKYGK